MGKMLIIKGLTVTRYNSKSFTIASGYCNDGGWQIANGEEELSGPISNWYSVRFAVTPGEKLRFAKLAGHSSYDGKNIRMALFSGANFTSIIERVVVDPSLDYTVPAGCKSITINLPLTGCNPGPATSFFQSESIPDQTNTKIYIIP